MAAGSIIIDFLMRTGAFETDTKRAEKALQRLQKQATDTGKAIGTAIVVGATAAAAGFQLLVDSASDFKDLEEQTGATAEDLASLSIAASVAGSSVADVAGQMNRLTKALTGVDDESKAAGAALTALGIPIEEFKRLDPVAQIDALAQAFNSAEKVSKQTAVAMALFGKNGAQMLSLFRELGAEGGRQKILTQEQIELADEYADRQKKQIATLKAYAQAAAIDVLPALNDLTAAAKDVAREFFGIDEAGKKLAGESPVKQFADSAISVLAFIVDAAQGVVRAFEAIGVGIGGAVAATEAARRLQFGAAKQIAAETAADIDRILSAELFSQRLQRLRSAAQQQAADFAANQSPAETARLGRGRVLNFDGAQGAGKAAKERTSEAQRYLENLQKQIEKTLDLTNYEQALLDIQQKRIGGLTPELEKQILAQAQLLDLTKQADAFRKAEIEVTTAKAQADLKALDAIKQGNDKLAEEIELLGLTKEQLNAVELQKIRVAAAEKESTLAKLEAQGVDEKQLQVLQEQIAALRQRESLLIAKGDKEADIEAQKNLEKAGENVRDTYAQSVADGILDGSRRGLDFTDIFIRELKAQFSKAVLQPVIEPVLKVQNDAIASILGALKGVFTPSDVGVGINNTGTSLPTAGGAATGTNFVERDMLTILHKGEAVVPKAYNPSAGGAAGNIIVQNYGGAQVQASRDADGTARIIVDAAQARVAADMASGTGPVARGWQGRYGNGAGNLPRRA